MFDYHDTYRHWLPSARAEIVKRYLRLRKAEYIDRYVRGGGNQEVFLSLGEWLSDKMREKGWHPSTKSACMNRFIVWRSCVIADAAPMMNKFNEDMEEIGLVFSELKRKIQKESKNAKNDCRLAPSAGGHS